MITYKYSFKIDVEMFLYTIKHRKWFKEHKIKYFWPTPLKVFKLLVDPPKPTFQVETKNSVICYWKSSGCWGMYNIHQNSILVYPWDNPGSLEETIKHEIIHLGHEHEVQGMTHEEKEKYIENKM